MCSSHCLRCTPGKSRGCSPSDQQGSRESVSGRWPSRSKMPDARQQGASATRVPPHNLQAEESLLGAMLLSRDAIVAAVEVQLDGRRLLQAGPRPHLRRHHVALRPGRPRRPGHRRRVAEPGRRARGHRRPGPAHQPPGRHAVHRQRRPLRPHHRGALAAPPAHPGGRRHRRDGLQPARRRGRRRRRGRGHGVRRGPAPGHRLHGQHPRPALGPARPPRGPVRAQPGDHRRPHRLHRPRPPARRPPALQPGDHRWPAWHGEGARPRHADPHAHRLDDDGRARRPATRSSTPRAGPAGSPSPRPVMHDRRCYEVAFDDGSTIVADADHQWFAYDFPAWKSFREAQYRPGRPPPTRSSAATRRAPPAAPGRDDPADGRRGRPRLRRRAPQLVPPARPARSTFPRPTCRSIRTCSAAGSATARRPARR